MPQATNSPDRYSLALQKLTEAEAYLVESGKAWCLFSKRNAYARPVGRLEPALIKALRDRGHLVERPGGGLEPLSLRQQASAKLTGHRPSRPDGGDTPSCTPVLNPAESPLAWLHSRKDKKGRPLISAEQLMAGERLRSDYERACLQTRVTASWDISLLGVKGRGNVDAHLSDNALDARQRLHEALDFVGPELASILVQVCCLSAGMEQAERILDLPQRSGKAVLSLALTALARHYGLVRRRPTQPPHEPLGRCWLPAAVSR